MDIYALDKVSVEEMKAYYAKYYPYEPNNQRVGRFAKSIGFYPTKQMINHKYVRFYINTNKGKKI